MVALNSTAAANREEWLAELAQAAYRSVLDRGYRGSFLDLELSLWHAIRQAAAPRAANRANIAETPSDVIAK